MRFVFGIEGVQGPYVGVRTTNGISWELGFSRTGNILDDKIYNLKDAATNSFAEGIDAILNKYDLGGNSK